MGAEDRRTTKLEVLLLSRAWDIERAMLVASGAGFLAYLAFLSQVFPYGIVIRSDTIDALKMFAAAFGVALCAPILRLTQTIEGAKTFPTGLLVIWFALFAGSLGMMGYGTYSFVSGATKSIGSQIKVAEKAIVVLKDLEERIDKLDKQLEEILQKQENLISGLENLAKSGPVEKAQIAKVKREVVGLTLRYREIRTTRQGLVSRRRQLERKLGRIVSGSIAD